MNVLVVEDEKYARINLENLILELEPGATIVASLDSVSSSVDWLRENIPDLIFLDIHLADSLSFDIFEKVEVKSPIIFTTAYDQYTLKAFKVNSVDYLLKPIDKQELQQALIKYRRVHRHTKQDILALKESVLNKQQSFQKRFMVKKGERIASVKSSDIAYFEGEDRYVYLVKSDGQRFFVDHKLSELEHLLDPQEFFRLNRSFIAHFDAIDTMTAMSKSRISVNLNPSAKRSVVVSTDNTRVFKEWLNR